MVFGLLGLLFNIASSYSNVLAATKKSNKPSFAPLLGLLPFVQLSLQHIAWLYASETGGQQGIVNSSAFLPLACAWGLQFAHNVGRMILAHVTKQPFPMFDSVVLVSLVGAIDASLPVVLGR